jgi:hypothetical protein
MPALSRALVSDARRALSCSLASLFCIVWRAVDPGKSDDDLREYLTKAAGDKLLTQDSLVPARVFAEALFRAVAVLRSQTWVRRA